MLPQIVPLLVLKLIQNFWHISGECYCSDEAQTHVKSTSGLNVQSVVWEFFLTKLLLNYSKFIKIWVKLLIFNLSLLEIKKNKFPYYRFFIWLIRIFWCGNQSCVTIGICCLVAKSFRKQEFVIGISGICGFNGM